MTEVSDGIIWCADGPLAVWSVGTVDSLGVDDDPTRAWFRLAAALTQLPTESQIVGLTAPMDAGELTERSTTRDRQRLIRESAGRWERGVYLVVSLDESYWSGAFRRFNGKFGGRSAPSREKTLRRRDHLAARLADFQLDPVADTEIAWMSNRLSDPNLTIREATRARSFDLELREGITSVSGPRRWVSAEGPLGRVFYAGAVMAEMPDWVWPGGGEWFRVCDMLPFRVDWSMRMRASSNREAKSKFERRRSELNYQAEADEDSIDVDLGDSASKALVAARESVDDALDALAENSRVPLDEPTISLFVSGAHPDDCNQLMTQLESLFEGSGIILQRPLGVQKDLLAGLTPSPSTPATLTGWSQPMLPRSLATGLPVAATPIGDPAGVFLGWQRMAETVPKRRTEREKEDAQKEDVQWTSAPVFFDPAAGPRKNKAGCAGFFGVQGGGKSMAAKVASQHVIDQGGRVVAYDPTEKREWSQWAEAVTPNHLIVSVDGSTPHNLDPLTVFEGMADRERYALGLASILTGVAATGSEATLIRRAIQELISSGDGFVELPHRIRKADHRSASELADSMASVIDTPLGRSLLSGEGERITSDIDAVVFQLSDLSLPSKEELSTELGRRQLLPEQVISQALLYVIAAVARDLTMSDDRFSLAVLEEAYVMVKASPQGRELVLQWVRDTRKHNASVFIVSQSFEDTDDELLYLLPNRFVFAQGNANRALDWVFPPHKDEDDDPARRKLRRDVLAEMKELIESDFVSGECLYRDMYGRRGIMRTALPDSLLIEAFDTNPVEKIAL